MLAQAADLLQLRLSGTGAVLRVEACGGVNIAVLLRQGQGGPGTLHIYPGHHHGAHARRRKQFAQQLFPVFVKGVVGIVGMGVKQRHSAAS